MNKDNYAPISAYELKQKKNGTSKNYGRTEAATKKRLATMKAKKEARKCQMS